MDYTQKYLKYKNKYLKLKNQFEQNGGAASPMAASPINSIAVPPAYQFLYNNHQGHPSYMHLDETCSETLEKLGFDIQYIYNSYQFEDALPDIINKLSLCLYARESDRNYWKNVWDRLRQLKTDIESDPMLDQQTKNQLLHLLRQRRMAVNSRFEGHKFTIRIIRSLYGEILELRDTRPPYIEIFYDDDMHIPYYERFIVTPRDVRPGYHHYNGRMYNSSSVEIPVNYINTFHNRYRTQIRNPTSANPDNNIAGALYPRSSVPIEPVIGQPIVSPVAAPAAGP